MSEEIQDLIANIEQKFDDEFGQSLNVDSGRDDPAPRQDHEQIQNPEALGIAHKQAPSLAQQSQNQRNNHEIVIEDELEHASSHNQQGAMHQQDAEPENEAAQNEVEEEGEQDENKYKQLSSKLETALKKISSSKNGFETYKQTQSMTMFARFEDYEKKKERDLLEKRRLEEEKRNHGLKDKPDINPKSKLMAEETQYRPIYKRFDKILEEKRRKLQQSEEQKKERDEEEYNAFIEQYRKHAKVQPEECRNSETYFNDMMVWKNKLDKEREEKLRQKQQSEKVGYTFKPELNQKSMRLLKNQKRVPIHQREVERPKTEVEEYTFQPKINKKRVK